MQRLRAPLLWLASLDLRLTILALPPLLPAMHRDLALDETGVAAIANLPVLTLAGSSVFGSLLVAKIGARRALAAGIFTIALASGLRGVGPSLPMLFAATFVMGLGIAAIQPVFPALTRAWFPERLAFGTALWTNGLLAGEAIAAALTLPVVLPLAGGRWPWAFALWGIVVALTGVALSAGARGAPDAAPSHGASWFPDFRDPLLWELGLLQAAASLSYFGANAFLPDYLHARGKAQLVGWCLLALNAGQLPATIFFGRLPLRALGRPQPALALAGLLALAATVLVCFDHPFTLIASSALVGFTAAWVLAITFAFPPLLAPPGQIARLSSGVFTVGYSIAFLASLAAGKAWDLSHEPAAAFAPFVLAVLLTAVLGPLLARRARFASALAAV